MGLLGRMIKALWNLLRGFPRLTRLGVGFLGVTLVLGVLAVGFGTGVLLLLFGLFLAAILLSLVFGVLNLRGLTVERFLPSHVYAGQEFEVGARISTRRRTVSFGVVLEDGPDGPYRRPGRAIALRVGDGEPAVVRYRARIRERGLRRVEKCVLSTRWPYGLFEHRETLRVKDEILVFPRIGGFRQDPLPGSRFMRRMTSTETVREKGEEEFRNLREYRPGDNPRLIAWKATARRRELMVKELEDDLTKRVSIFLETLLPKTARRGERLRLERSISFVATLLRRLAKRRYWIQLHAYGPKPFVIDAGRGARHLNRVMERLAVLEPAEEGGIQDLVRRAGAESLATSLPVLVLPTLSEPRLRAALRLLPERRAPVLFQMEGAWERSVFVTRDNDRLRVQLER